MSATPEKRVLDLVGKKGILRPRDLQAKELPADYLWRLHQKGKLVKVGYGCTAIPGAGLSEHQTIIEAALRVPTELSVCSRPSGFHDLTTQAPFQIWMAIDVKARSPKEEIIPLRIVRFSGRALTEGVESHSIEGAKIENLQSRKNSRRLFKYRNKIGLDVAIEALRDCWRKKLATSDQLWHYAKVCRVANVMGHTWSR